ncbi:hypothetical protein NVP1238A_10 [Vibrio phage 1.238.A._10N.261.52.F10]|uniref:Uncharacterized protein n=2 Tax=Pariacacavirus TaxID=2948856 RepID=A0A2I7RUE3_9CAUD|nr:hypothetical protein KNT79_gp10 [Vibrio phage 1.238.A._10N.261.52.F10]YP_010093456.1 hypothetical protein KNT80_gp13 [Vibrio phage 1.245.O._10N.261.54.C7]AUR97259.1 hypothetical protein NVP1238A_10 [Vibrio phage 1.238.A._10N.261.52.F10]AUR97353.1 hypothetical protein NVP1238B_11 [Vibrio phage 1.238.B._10N.261.52.F10]AUR97926.1 hypothetical protein NVP1245O_13 [Vibrio phage 1.245.O._10N.261.54.C7]
MSTGLTVTDLSTALPKQIRGKVSQELVDAVNNMVQDPEMREMYRENIISYTNVLDKGKFRLPQYLDAVRYVSFKLMGETNIKSYIKTFPSKYAGFKTKGVSEADIAKYVHAYNKSKLVNLIWEQSMVPFHVLNQDARQKALNTQVELMMHAQSEKVRSDAANSVLTHLKPPETTKIELDVGVQETSALSELREVSANFAAMQKNMALAGGMTAKEIAHQSLTIEGEVEDV